MLERRSNLVLTLAALAITLSAFGHASFITPAEDDPNDYTPEERAVLGQRALEENCLMCHARDLIDTQRLTPAQWQAEIDKMVGWGSPITKSEQLLLIEYLNNHFNPTANPPASVRSTLPAASADVLPAAPSGVLAASPGAPRPDSTDVVADGAPAATPRALSEGAEAYNKHCANCHGPDALGGDNGPNLVRKPILTHPGAYRRLLDTGLRKMPSLRASLAPTDPDTILAWLRTR